ncbi:MAG: RNA polymerase-associated protein RapA [Haliscomenobacter sp.]|nr:RNA polymerase-associated protein RapA [Haliscomenobacter sp.]
MQFNPGSLVRLRERDWIVMPSADNDLLLLKPLGGTEDELTGVYLPLLSRDEQPQLASFPLPGPADLGDFASARLLFNASRLSFRNAAGPFRSIGKFSFRPRAYQMIPLIMALRQENPVRLLIADDVGIGKTIEALMIVREMLDRGEIKRFAIVCLPHLCEQWKQELLDKFGIEAEIIRSSTAAQLDRKIYGDANIFHYFPFQVISIDYIKSEQRRQEFVHECPELVIVDEAHTCARPLGAYDSQMQRYYLVKKIAEKPQQHLVLLTATPHSGKQGEFQSLLGLLKPEFETQDLAEAGEKERRAIARHFVQRRRADIERWMGEDNPFPRRIPSEIPYQLGEAYGKTYWEVFHFVQNLVEGIGQPLNRSQRIQYWTALALLRGVISSPAAGALMLQNRASRLEDEEDEPENGLPDNPVLDSDYGSEGDTEPTQLLDKHPWTDSQIRRLRDLAKSMETLYGIGADAKAAQTLATLREWLREGYNPIVYCRYIETAKYLGALLKDALPSDVAVETVTSELDDEARRERVEALKEYPRRVLVATDCLSEGINLQHLFTAVLHYDLPWNPNRLEQREGRVDRFGQSAPEVRIGLLYGQDNPMDAIVLKVLLQKAREIREALGISVPFPENSQTIMDAVLNATLLNPQSARQYSQQGTLFDTREFTVYKDTEAAVSAAYQLAAEQQKAIRTVFAQHAIKAQDIELDLQEVDAVIGNMAAVETFVTQSVRYLGGQIDRWKRGYRLLTDNLPGGLKDLFPGKKEALLSFDSPTPAGYRYIGRNHPLVERLSQMVLANALYPEGNRFQIARSSVIRCRDVAHLTVVAEFRVRNVIATLQGRQEIVAEEMLLWGWQGDADDPACHLTPEAAKFLLENSAPSANLSAPEQAYWLEEALRTLQNLDPLLEKKAVDRAEHLIEAHERFRAALDKGHRYKVVEPVLPMDLLGLYVLVPDTAAQN